MEARAPTWETTLFNVSVPRALEETLVKKVKNLHSLFRDVIWRAFYSFSEAQFRNYAPYTRKRIGTGSFEKK